MAKSDFLENDIIKHYYRTGSATTISGIYVALFTSITNDSSGGTEVTGAGYARKLHGPSDATWAATSGTDGETSNVGAITFGAPTADWGTITYFATYDAITSGNRLHHGILTAPRLVENGDAAPLFASGALTITES